MGEEPGDVGPWLLGGLVSVTVSVVGEERVTGVRERLDGGGLVRHREPRQELARHCR
jgi:hypothetical protein